MMKEIQECPWPQETVTWKWWLFFDKPVCHSLHFSHTHYLSPNLTDSFLSFIFILLHFFSLSCLFPFHSQELEWSPEITKLEQRPYMKLHTTDMSMYWSSSLIMVRAKKKKKTAAPSHQSKQSVQTHFRFRFFDMNIYIYIYIYIFKSPSLLYLSGADMMARDILFRTPVHLAAEGGHVGALKFLGNHGTSFSLFSETCFFLPILTSNKKQASEISEDFDLRLCVWCIPPHICGVECYRKNSHLSRPPLFIGVNINFYRWGDVIGLLLFNSCTVCRQIGSWTRGVLPCLEKMSQFHHRAALSYIGVLVFKKRFPSSQFVVCSPTFWPKLWHMVWNPQR